MDPLLIVLAIIVFFFVFPEEIVGMVISAWHWLKARFGGGDDLNNDS